MVEKTRRLCIYIQTMSKKDSTTKVLTKKKVSRPGVHSKTKTSSTKSSKNYKKAYRSQGR